MQRLYSPALDPLYRFSTGQMAACTFALARYLVNSRDFRPSFNCPSTLQTEAAGIDLSVRVLPERRKTHPSVIFLSSRQSAGIGIPTKSEMFDGHASQCWIN